MNSIGGDEMNPTAKQRELMLHALGNPKKDQRPYRNYFHATPRTDDDMDLSLLIPGDLVELFRTPCPGMPYNSYAVTARGRSLLGVGEPIR